MDTKDVIFELRTKKGLSQDELAEKLYVTRQAVSRWETGETLPSVDTLQLISQVFSVSVDTLLGADVPLRSWLHNWVSRVRWWAVAGLRMLTC